MSNWKQRMAQRQREDEEFERRRQEEKAQQADCPHIDCSVKKTYWSGKPKEVECLDCRAINYIEEDKD